MSFDLNVFDLDDIHDDEEALADLMEDSSRWGAPPTPRLKALLDDLEKRYPSLDDDPDGSPWASWPLGDTMLDGHAISLNIAWSQADKMSRELRVACKQAGLILHDPQEGQIIRPSQHGGSPSHTPRRWWRRKAR